MTTTELDSLTDYLAKTDSTMFPTAEKLVYYNIAYGLLNGLVIDEQEDSYELEFTATTVADQPDYLAESRIHHINWLKINYGEGFVPARYKSEQALISEFGTDLETELTSWDTSDPIYFYKGDHFFVYPAPTAAQAGADRLKTSMELLPDDLTAGQTPDLPETFHYLLGEYAAFRYHDNNGEDSQAIKRKTSFEEGTALMVSTMFPRARQAEIQASVPNDDGSDY